jgi:hypothetical protein
LGVCAVWIETFFPKGWDSAPQKLRQKDPRPFAPLIARIQNQGKEDRLEKSPGEPFGNRVSGRSIRFPGFCGKPVEYVLEAPGEGFQSDFFGQSSFPVRGRGAKRAIQPV